MEQETVTETAEPRKPWTQPALTKLNAEQAEISGGNFAEGPEATS